MKPAPPYVLRLLTSAAIVFLASAYSIARADSGGCTAFLNVNVVPMDTERVLPAQTVVVRDGRISAVGPTATTEVPNDTVRIDAREPRT